MTKRQSAKRFARGLYVYRGVRIEQTKKGWEFGFGLKVKIAKTLKEAKYSIDFERDKADERV